MAAAFRCPHCPIMWATDRAGDELVTGPHGVVMTLAQLIRSEMLAHIHATHPEAEPCPR